MERYRKGEEEETLGRITQGLNFNVARVACLKLEYQYYLKTSAEFEENGYNNRHLFYIQFMITF
jgi:hypothetical protein